ncbi:hypothetical protein BCY91_06310 [Pelobium manganitolerans]|uniref:Uncharacterized protein n=1 Tax=Pelobium manganitolerans TaxID=1842495 RepID=A0A419S4X1_9SPHI|nr:hypothetical protein [Pelobium manganitolerans]RKD15131.1 hypothetical protein BCY91_06310 [Pelobium manganitolerans]
MKLQYAIIASLLLCSTLAAKAQHHMPGMKDSTQHENMMQDSSMMDMPPMSHSYSLNLPMSRNGSGTAWLPDASPMYGIMIHSKKWMYMFHGNIAPRYTKQDLGNTGSRGDEAFGAPNWFMAMGQRKVGQKGLFHFSAMLSLDRVTEGGSGYPLLFQSGESWEGRPLVDHQHPHDLISELSVGYTYAFSKKSDLSIYVGYPGEPALGSVAFMHRPSALSNPDAPISHHWNDGTHITFGVATIGYRYDKFKIEASSFTGREPDENRYNFDKPRFDSYSGRLSFNPSQNWSFQVSQGWIKSPEALHAEEDITRTTASAIYSLPFGEEKSLNTTALWGLNKSKGADGENAALLEATLRLQRLALYTRYEWTQKSVEELDLDPVTYGDHALFPVNALTLGLNYDLFYIGKFRVAGGGQLTGYHADNRLDNLYGKNPISGQVFLRIYPSLMKMNM